MINQYKATNVYSRKIKTAKKLQNTHLVGMYILVQIFVYFWKEIYNTRVTHLE